MSSFSSSWLALRETADLRARNGELASTLQAHFALRDHLSIIDLGAGTGANLRALYSLLPNQQTWTLVDHNDLLLETAKQSLCNWADTATVSGNNLQLVKDHRTIDVKLKRAELHDFLEGNREIKTDLITASAFFDLASVETIRSITKFTTSLRATFFTVLTYNGVQKWQPRHPDDNALVAAFHHHQRQDKGLGNAAGPTAPQVLFDQFQASGYHVQDGDSSWQLQTPRDQELLTELERGYIEAVKDTGRIGDDILEKWSRHKRTGAVVGHTDTLAIPGYTTYHDDEDE